MSIPTVYSIYIPRVLVGLNEEWFIHNFNAIHFGLVKRVDFSPIMDTKTNEERTDIEKVFVHFSEIYRSAYAMAIIDALEKENGVHKIFITQTNFLMLIKNMLVLAKKEKIDAAIAVEYQQLLLSLQKSEEILLNQNQKEIKNLILEEIIKRYQYKEGLYLYYTKSNTEIRKALTILNDQKEYNTLLKI